MTAANLPALLQRFFTERLQAQLGASPHTVASYRDTFRLLLVFASPRLARAPSQLCLEDLDAALIGAFLDHLEHERTCTPKTRNTRLAAVRAFFRFVAYAEPACSLQCQQVLAVPNKRHERPTVEFLTEEETAALLAAPDMTTWIGRRDHTLVSAHRITNIRSIGFSARCCGAAFTAHVDRTGTRAPRASNHSEGRNFARGGDRRRLPRPVIAVERDPSHHRRSTERAAWLWLIDVWIAHQRDIAALVGAATRQAKRISDRRTPRT